MSNIMQIEIITPKSSKSTNIETSSDVSTNSTPQNHKKWSEKEKKNLVNLIKLYNYKDFKEIAKFFPNKTPEQCSEVWEKFKKCEAAKGHWTEEEDKLLIDYVNKNGANKWIECTKIIPGRSAKQCREHWSNSLAPNLKKGEWSVEEDFLIFTLYNKYGSWKKIVPIFNGRTENSIKNRFFSQLRKTATNPINKGIKRKKYTASKTKLNFLLNYLEMTTQSIREQLIEEKKMSETEIEEYINNIENKLSELNEQKNILFLSKKTKRNKKTKEDDDEKNESENLNLIEDEEEEGEEEKNNNMEEKEKNIYNEIKEIPFEDDSNNHINKNDKFTLNKIDTFKIIDNDFTNNAINLNTMEDRLFPDNLYEDIVDRICNINDKFCNNLTDYDNNLFNDQYNYDNFFSKDLPLKYPFLYFDGEQN